METKIKTDKRSLFFKFVALYLVSMCLLVFIIIYLLPKYGATTPVTAANPINTNSESQEGELLSKIESINKAFLRLKEFDKEDLSAMSSADKQSVTNAESNLNNVLDSIAKIARSYNSETSLRLQNFVESYRLTLNDRSAMNAYKTALLSSTGSGDSKNLVVKLQADLQLRNEKIEELKGDIESLNGDLKSKSPSIDNQQVVTDLKSTVATQQKKIAALTADLKESEAEKNKKPDDNDADLKKQNAALEQKVNQLTSDLRIFQADCNITRADANQIISNSKQRKQLLSEALTILNSVAGSGDANTKNKVAEKLNRLNKVASAVHD